MLAIACLLAAVVVATGNSVPEHFYSEKFEDHQRPIRNDDALLTEYTFQTRVDHFRPQDGRVAEFTYTVNEEHYTAGGPIFIYVGDGGVYTDEWLQGGLMFDIAREVGAALATADHRYFGRNIPTPTASFDDLQFLTVDQALGDLSLLINAVRQQLNSNGRVILFGIGYGGSLAAHARKKFPHLVDAVWASSAYFRAEAIDTQYYDNLSMIIREHGGTECADRVDNAFNVLSLLIESAEVEYLQERLRLCDPLDTENPQEIAILIFRFVDLIAQYIRRHQLNGLQNFCRDMNALQADTLNSLVRWVEYAYGGRPECVTMNYETVIGRISQTNWTEFEGNYAAARAFEYTYCTQLGGLKTTSDFALGIFPADAITAEYQYQVCRDVFGEQYNSSSLAGAVELLNFSYGGQDQMISHVVFSNAGLDPYIHHGIAEYDIEESEVVFLRYNAAGADLYAQSATDSIDLATAKTTIRELITRWASGTPRHV